MEYLLKLNICDAAKANLGSIRPASTEYWFTGSVRRMGVVATAVLCIVFLLSPTVRAEDPFATGPYPVGWYDALSNWLDVPGIYFSGGNTTSKIARARSKADLAPS